MVEVVMHLCDWEGCNKERQGGPWHLANDTTRATFELCAEHAEPLKPFLRIGESRARVPMDAESSPSDPITLNQLRSIAAQQRQSRGEES